MINPIDIKIVNINQVRANKNNPRIIKDDRYKKLVNSIKFFPEMLWKRPLVVESNEKGFTVLGGNQRLRAINEVFKIPRHELEQEIAGVPNKKTILAFYDSKQIPILLCDEWTLEQKREFIVRDNIDFGQWDMEKLSTEYDMDELEEMGLMVDETDKPDLPPDLENDLIDDAEKIKTNIKLGDLIEIGRHRLLCGDSTKREDVERLMNEQKADMVFTDPPYGIDIVGGGGVPKFSGKVGGGGVVEAKVYNKIIGDNTTDSAKKHYELCCLLGYENFILWGGNYFTDFLKPSSCWVIWDKENNGNFADVEMAWTSFSKSAKLYKWLWNGMSRKGDHLTEGKTRFHPTQKPVGLFFEIFKDFPFDICLDGFLGSGSTMVACEQTKRICYGMELEPIYCQVIINRMKKNFPELDIKVNGKEYKE